jgi:3,4-dihydroxy-2-butanone 4-phosphate synthase
MSELNKTSELIFEQILPDVRRGRMIILVDDEERENEGDLFVAAERATPDAINFMAKHGRGLVSLALTEQRMRELGLSLLSDDIGKHDQVSDLLSRRRSMRARAWALACRRMTARAPLPWRSPTAPVRAT